MAMNDCGISEGDNDDDGDDNSGAGDAETLHQVHLQLCFLFLLPLWVDNHHDDKEGFNIIIKTT